MRKVDQGGGVAYRAAPPEGPSPNDRMRPRANVAAVLLAATLRLGELLDISAMQETDEVRLLVGGIADGLRDLSGEN